MVCLHSSTPSFRLASAGKPRPRPREASRSRPQPRSLLHCVPSSPPLRSCRVHRRRRHGSVSDGRGRPGNLPSRLKGRSRPRRRLGTGGRLSPASWRPEPRASGVSASSRRGPRTPRIPSLPCSLAFPWDPALCSSQRAGAGRIPVAGRARGGGLAWPRESWARSRGEGASRPAAAPAGASSLCGRRGPWNSHFLID